MLMQPINTVGSLSPRVFQLKCSMMLQAGVAMGLAKTIAARFPEWGAEFATLMVSSTVIHRSLHQRLHFLVALHLHPADAPSCVSKLHTRADFPHKR